MSQTLNRSIVTVAGQQTYRVPGSPDEVPASITVNGSNATFTSAMDVVGGVMTVTITAPTISVNGQPIVFSYTQTSSNLQDPMRVSPGDGLVSGVITSTTTGIATLWQVPIDNYSALSVMITAVQSGGQFEVQVTNDPAGLVGWRAVRGVNVNTAVTTTLMSSADFWIFDVGGFVLARLRRTAGSAGTSTVYARLSLENISTDVTVNGGTVTVSGLSATGSTSGGYGTPYHLASAAASANPALVKSSGGRLYRVRGRNAAAAVRYLKFFNRNTVPTPGTDTAVWQLALDPGASFDLDLDPIGAVFNTGIAIAITAAPALNDGTVIAAGDIVGLNIFFA